MIILHTLNTYICRALDIAGVGTIFNVFGYDVVFGFWFEAITVPSTCGCATCYATVAGKNIVSLYCQYVCLSSLMKAVKLMKNCVSSSLLGDLFLHILFQIINKTLMDLFINKKSEGKKFLVLSLKVPCWVVTTPST